MICYKATPRCAKCKKRRMKNTRKCECGHIHQVGTSSSSYSDRSYGPELSDAAKAYSGWGDR